MAKQAKPKQNKSDNFDRPNGKAWKKGHGTNPPLEQAKRDSERSKKNN